MAEDYALIHRNVEGPKSTVKPQPTPLTEGSVSLVGDESGEKPIVILRDTAALQSLLLEGVLPLAGKTSDASVVIAGIECGHLIAPLHKLAEEDVGMFPACAVTRSMREARRVGHDPPTVARASQCVRNKDKSDQGSNFLSKAFQAAMRRMGVRHQVSSAYHPESQGALERFHQTLKNMVRIYCHETDDQWDEMVPLLLFAARECVQDTLGFSPFELVFGHESM
ncbi:hypothetical protein C7M84_004187 [Penaeus vannamei]|uniref:Integrase catalytic domain-containing protein n=1 Tax=Penaeus vannamei TaxID=6689 RepID=A0A3R7P6Y4_PENVA|nr:hypothetical protein C7M84_004187 [Penaeus vannamei]